MRETASQTKGRERREEVSQEQEAPLFRFFSFLFVSFSREIFLGSAVVVDLASHITHLESDATVATSDDDVLPLDHAMRHRVSLYLFCSKKTLILDGEVFLTPNFS